MRKIGGDGFETLWHATDPKKVIGTLYFNTILRSMNSGGSFSIELNLPSTDDGIFLTPLGSSNANPDEIYTASRLGVHRNTDFGGPGH